MRAIVAASVLAVCLTVAARAETPIAVTVDGATVDLTMVDAAPAEALAQLAARAGFVLEGADGLSSAPMSLHVRGDLPTLIDMLVGPVSHVALYDAATPPHLVRLVLLSSGRRVPTLEVQSASLPDELPPGDPALGASRIGPDAVRATIRARLGLTLP